jgi:hypothetical protein
MNIVFADTGYWIALLDRQDTLHDKAVELSQTIAPGRIMTTEMVLTEVLNYFANRGRFLRAATIAMLQKLEDNPGKDVVEGVSPLLGGTGVGSFCCREGHRCAGIDPVTDWSGHCLLGYRLSPEMPAASVWQ